ncbi:recombinase family protein [Alkalibaculum bacchi]|uniref:recombinase family protein n=1 Tax=Alkalibaculum bacchi TaxID=645887 RepID=UPI0026ED37DC|nr:recombinase family protein [Alkalibaculum bacchi]
MDSRVAIYARVSTVEQAEKGYSIDEQIANIKSECEERGKKVVKVYADRGISGSSVKNRLQLQQLLKDAEDNLFDEVITWKTNRLARNHLDLLKIVDHLKRYDITFSSLTEPFETNTNQGKLMMSLLASIAEFERGTIIDNVKMGMKGRAKQGKYNGGRVLGYESVDDGTGKTKLEIVESEAIIIVKIYNYYLEGKGYKAIVNRINQQGYKTKNGTHFNTFGIKYILTNPLYKGYIRFGRYVDWCNKRRKGKNEEYILVKGEHEAIIDEEDWDRVQLLMNKKSFKPSRVYDGEFLLTGILKCPVCGYSMVRGRGHYKSKTTGAVTIYQYYQCGNFHNKGSAVCTANSIRQEYIEEAVLNRINEVTINTKIVEDVVQRLNEERNKNIKPIEEEIKLSKDELEKDNIKKDKLIELFQLDLITKEDLAKRIKKSDEDVLKIEERLLYLESNLEYSSSDEIPVDYVKEKLSKFSALLQQASNENKKLLLHLLVEKITVNEKRELDSIEIKYNEDIEMIIGSSNEDDPIFVFRLVI